MTANIHEAMLAEILPEGSAEAAASPRMVLLDLARQDQQQRQVLVIGGSIDGEDFDELCRNGCKVETVFYPEEGVRLLGERKWDVAAVFPQIDAEADGVAMVKGLKLADDATSDWTQARVRNGETPVALLPFRGTVEYALYLDRERWRLVETKTLPIWQGILAATEL